MMAGGFWEQVEAIKTANQARIDEAYQRGLAASDKRVRELEEALKDALASLVAATSLLERGGKKAAPSDTMFAIMLKDYAESINRARLALSHTKEGEG